MASLVNALVYYAIMWCGMNFIRIERQKNSNRLLLGCILANKELTNAWLGCMKKLERQLHSASITSQSPVTTSEVSRSPVASRVNGLTESAHHRTSSSPLKPSLPHSSDSSSRIVLDSGMLACASVLLQLVLPVIHGTRGEIWIFVRLFCDNSSRKSPLTLICSGTMGW